MAKSKVLPPDYMATTTADYLATAQGTAAKSEPALKRWAPILIAATVLYRTWQNVKLRRRVGTLERMIGAGG